MRTRTSTHEKGRGEAVGRRARDGRGAVLMDRRPSANEYLHAAHDGGVHFARGGECARSARLLGVLPDSPLWVSG